MHFSYAFNKELLIIFAYICKAKNRAILGFQIISIGKNHILLNTTFIYERRG